MISYDKLFNVLQQQKITSYTIRQERIISQGVITKLRSGSGSIDVSSLDKILSWLYQNRGVKLQVSDLIEWYPDPEDKEQS